MKNILILLILVSINLFGLCLKVSSSSGQICSGDSVSIDDISKNFTTTMKVSDNGVTVIDIPIYLYSDSAEEVSMTITNNSFLQNSSGEIIDTSFYYVVSSSESTITEGNSFVLLANGAGGRDGNSVVGYIRIKVNTLSDTQTVGSYLLSKNMDVKLASSGDSSGTLSSSGLVEYVTIVSFENSISGYTSGGKFIDAVVDYVNFNLNAVNTQTRDVYVKSNSNNACTISFTPTDLVSQVDDDYTIGMSYYYGTKKIENNTPFTVVNGKNGGSKVGEMKFETDIVDASVIAGEYKATLAVTVSAR
jgi:hypothetical protein